MGNGKDNPETTRRRRERRLAEGLCAKCGQRPPQAEMKHCEHCLAEASRYAKKRRVTPEGRQRDNERKSAWRRANPEKANAQVQRYSSRLRKKVLDHYGGACACCGEKEYAFLTLHHINGDGKEHRATFNHTKLYKQLRDEGFPDWISILCWNCHMSLTYYGACPHGGV